MTRETMRSARGSCLRYRALPTGRVLGIVATRGRNGNG
jgi:hypothetical protein